MIAEKYCTLKDEWKLDEPIKVTNKSVLSNLKKMLKITLIPPVITALCKCFFSAVRWIKTWLRFSMDQSRFDILTLLNIEKDILKNFNKEWILEELAKKSRKIKLLKAVSIR